MHIVIFPQIALLVNVCFNILLLITANALDSHTVDLPTVTENAVLPIESPIVSLLIVMYLLLLVIGTKGEVMKCLFFKLHECNLNKRSQNRRTQLVHVYEIVMNKLFILKK